MISNIKEKIKEEIQRVRAIKQAKIRQEFLPEALEIVEKPSAPMGHFVILMTAGIILFFVAWSVIGKMDEVVTARGKVTTVTGVQILQTLNTGIVERICVVEGERVIAGQDIIVMDSSVSNISLQSTEETLSLLELQNELLTQILEGRDISAMLLGENREEERQIIEYVLAIQKEYESQKSELNGNAVQALANISLEKENLTKIQENITFLKQQKDSLNGLLTHSNTEEKNGEKIVLSIQVKEKQLADYQTLYEVGAVSKAEVNQISVELEQLKKDYEVQQSLGIYEDYENSLRIIEIDSQLSAAQSDLTAQETVITMAEQQYEQVLESIDTLEAEYKTGVSNLIVENEKQLVEYNMNHEIQEIAVEQQRLISPVDGVIKTLEVNTEGSVLTTAQTVATIVPDNDEMLVEISILNQDIGCIEIGQEVVIKLDAYNFQEYGKLEGTITFVSPDAILDEQKGWIYVAKVKINDAKFKETNPEVEIGVGMECTTEIKVGERRIIEFFLDPLVEHFDGSLKIR